MKIIGLMALFIIAPFFNFLMGYFSGWLIKITIGPMIAQGFALVDFNLPLNKFPLFFGTLSIVAAFFRSMSIRSRGEKHETY